MVSSLLSRIGIESFGPVLSARTEILGPINASIDGGAGWGDTAKTIASFTAEGGVIHAFEPFPGNHRFFENCDDRIHLLKAAVSDKAGRGQFFVSHVVGENDAWAEKNLIGYSSVGQLAGKMQALGHLKRKIRAIFDNNSRVTPPHYVNVPVTRIDQAVAESHFDFAKFDLQGGEYRALRGMGKLLANTDMLWIEFSNQPHLLEYLLERDFLLFDTNYLCHVARAADLGDFGLQPMHRVSLSTSQEALIARRVSDCIDYPKWFAHAKRKGGIIQTDLLAINPKFSSIFMLMLGKLSGTYTAVPSTAQPAAF